MTPVGVLLFFLLGCNLTHRVVEGEAQDLDEEVDGIASFVPLWPTPVTVFDDQAWGRQAKRNSRPTARPTGVRVFEAAGATRRYW